MGDVDAVVEDGRLAKHHVFGSDLVVLFGIFTTLEPYEVCNACAIGEMGYYALLARPHLERLETEDMTNDLHERHIAGQFVDGIDL